MRIREWERLVAVHFGFLEAQGFARAPGGDSSSGWATSVLYRSDVHAVEVTYSVEFDRAEVLLMRLVEGKVPEHEIFSESGPFNRTLLDNVVEAREPGRLPELRGAAGLKEGELERALELWARVLQEVAPDFLQGDSSAFDDARGVVAARVEDHLPND